VNRELGRLGLESFLLSSIFGETALGNDSVRLLLYDNRKTDSAVGERTAIPKHIFAKLANCPIPSRGIATSRSLPAVRDVHGDVIPEISYKV